MSLIKIKNIVWQKEPVEIARDLETVLRNNLGEMQRNVTM